MRPGKDSIVSKDVSLSSDTGRKLQGGWCMGAFLQTGKQCPKDVTMVGLKGKPKVDKSSEEV